MDDRRLATIIGELLRAGVLLAAATVFAGGAIYLARHYADTVAFHNFVAGAPSTRSLSAIFKSAAYGSSQAFIEIGLLLLILTPIARVAVALVGFFLERDRMYAAVSLLVLVILLFSLIHAI